MYLNLLLRNIAFWDMIHVLKFIKMCCHWAENFSVNVIELLAMFYIMDTLRFVTNDEIIYLEVGNQWVFF